MSPEDNQDPNAEIDDILRQMRLEMGGERPEETKSETSAEAKVEIVETESADEEQEIQPEAPEPRLDTLEASEDPTLLDAMLTDLPHTEYAELSQEPANLEEDTPVQNEEPIASRDEDTRSTRRRERRPTKRSVTPTHDREAPIASGFAELLEPEPAPAPAAAPALPQRAAWVLGVLFALNGLAILGLAAAVYSLRPTSQTNEATLLELLRETRTAQPAATEPVGQLPSQDTVSDAVMAQAERGTRLFESGHYEQALRLLQESAAQMPQRSDLLWLAGVSAMHLEQWSDALNSFNRLVQVFPNSPNSYEARLNTGACYEALGLYPQAIKSYYRLIALQGRLTAEQQKMLPITQVRIADAYRKYAAGIDIARDGN